METFELRELRLAGNGTEFDLSDDWACLVIDVEAHNQTSWAVRLDNTCQSLMPDGRSYEATMLTTDGQRFTGTVWCRKNHMTLVRDNAILLQGTGPLHGYASE